MTNLASRDFLNFDGVVEQGMSWKVFDDVFFYDFDSFVRIVDLKENFQTFRIKFALGLYRERSLCARLDTGPG